jgi:hypothetical protein
MWVAEVGLARQTASDSKVGNNNNEAFMSDNNNNDKLDSPNVPARCLTEEKVRMLTTRFNNSMHAAAAQAMEWSRSGTNNRHGARRQARHMARSYHH